MQASCLQENLSRGLAIIGRAVATRPTLPVLSHVLMATEDAQIKLAATDLELFVICWIGSRVEQEGEITLPARLLTDLINSLPQERIDLFLDGQTLHLVCGRSEADVKGIDAQEFPLIPAVDNEVSGNSPEMLLEPSLLRQMIAQVVFAAATDESRPILTGVLARFDQDTLTLAAADGFRLSVRSARLSTPAPQPISVVIPAKALNELARVSGDEEEPIGMYITPSRSQVLFHLQGNTGANEGKIFGIDLVSQLIEGNFPDFNQIVPKSRTTRTVLNTQELLKACKTTNIFARSEANIVQFDLDPVAGKLTISATSAEMGDSEVELDAAIEGEPVTIAFNVRFLIDALSVMDSAQVALETNSAASPGVLKPLDDSNFVHVIMPMHIRSR
ncbi:MAG: DNA polymerase III subunit beta [Anaerolineae bacterium]|nr:DNA polymerase III subunit beta [Anaerolineae bacterium]